MLRFVKYQGLGNDFVVIDHEISPREAIAVCDRRFGVGADGVLMVLPSREADARMRILNADGSEAEMCGNGIRCVAKELHDSGRITKDVIAIETGNGVLSCAVTPGKDGLIDTVAVEMGRPRKEREQLNEPLTVGGRTFAMTCVSMGNPHAVTFVESDENLRALAEQFGPLVEKHAWFPKRTNAEFARVKNGEIELVVWERGCGITLACGTGACGTAAAAAWTGRAPKGREIAVHLLGGTLGITVADDFSGVRMRGPARVAFHAECDLEQLVREMPATSAS